MNKINVFVPPVKDDFEYNKDGSIPFNIFLAGTIDNGNTEWIKVSTPNNSGEFRIGWYEKYFLEKKKEFEEKHGEPLF